MKTMPDDAKPSKDESRSHYKIVKRGIAPNDDTANEEAVYDVEHRTVDSRRNSYEAGLFVEDDSYPKTGTMDSRVSGSVAPSDIGEHKEMLSY